MNRESRIEAETNKPVFGLENVLTRVGKVTNYLLENVIRNVEK